MMKLKWILPLSLGLFIAQAGAEQAAAVNGNRPGAAKPEAGAPVKLEMSPNSLAEANEANRKRVLKGGRLSPREKAAVSKAQVASANKPEGEAFLAANQAKKGVITLPSGVQYRVLRAGKGQSPTDKSQVMCRYTGMLIDGKTFDKTDKKPTLLNVAGFVPGLKEAVKLMQPGAKWEIVIPPQLAFGSVGNRGVGPNAVLIYQMEILSVK
ncbi:MAG: FKBP-type peptidyl-prolyl cis-trans isomerase [Nitrosomonadales bacterium]|nr:FKBP-type peptidyl-prolyl cis-trans isomerase [Nitrosomonadales bacterium]